MLLRRGLADVEAIAAAENAAAVLEHSGNMFRANMQGVDKRELMDRIIEYAYNRDNLEPTLFAFDLMYKRTH